MEEKYPLGTRVEQLNPSTNILSGTVMDFPFPATSLSPENLPTDLNCTILFNNGTTSSAPLQEMASLIPPPPVGHLLGDLSSSQDSLLPPFLCINSKITYEQDGQYHKGYLTKRDGTYCFSFKSHVNKKSKDWGINLPNLPMNWVDLCIEGLLIPSHISCMLLHSSSSPTPTIFDPVASFVSAVNLHLKCPPSLLKGLTDSHPDQKIWFNSFYEKKQSIESLHTFCKITLGEYQALRKKGALKAIPTMCILSIKHDKNLLPLCAKSRIVVLGNHEDRIWSKGNWYAPVLWSDSLRFLVTMAVSKRCPLRQDDCKNAFCQGVLPEDKITIVRPPSSDPKAQPNEY
jgi:hypothetical protein